MAFYYQHVGEAMADRDFPKSLGTVSTGVVSFTVDELLSWPDLLEAAPRRDLDDLRHLSADGLQVWGLPQGAEQVVKDIAPGDSLMLMSSKVFEFIGTVAYRVPEFTSDVSTRIWGEPWFPIIVFIHRGQFIELEWDDFRRKLSFDPAYHMRGNTMKVGPSRIRSSAFGSEAALVEWCRSMHPALTR
jgi:hypothetical protein